MILDKEKSYDNEIAQLKADVNNIKNFTANKIITVYAGENAERIVTFRTFGYHTYIMWAGKDAVYDVLLNGTSPAILSGSGSDIVRIISFDDYTYTLGVGGFEWYSYGLLLTSGAFV